MSGSYPGSLDGHAAFEPKEEDGRGRPPIGAELDRNTQSNGVPFPGSNIFVACGAGATWPLPATGFPAETHL